MNVIILGQLALESSTVFRFCTFISEMMERKDDNDNYDIFLIVSPNIQGSFTLLLLFI